MTVVDGRYPANRTRFSMKDTGAFTHLSVTIRIASKLQAVLFGGLLVPGKWVGPMGKWI